jgi:hypothetical protein
MLRDRGDLLKYAISDALMRARKIVRGLRQGLTVSEREAVAEAAVDELRALPDDPWNLKEKLPMPEGPAIGHGSPDNWHKPKLD